MGQPQSLHKNNSTLTSLAQSFDLNQYLGTWYEISRFPLKWESNCVNATAKYTKGEMDNTIMVENTCIMENGSTYSRKGMASIPINSGRKDHLKLVFTDGLPSDGPSDYWVLDTDYTTYALVGNEKRDHAWILCRYPMMSSCLYSALVTHLKTLSYDTTKLVTHTNTITACVDSNTI
jgi:apolipoprotein D and lipocalin family protein